MHRPQSIRPGSPMRDLGIFFTFTFAISWTCFFAYAALDQRVLGSAFAWVRTVVLYVGIFAPAIVAFVLTRLIAGRNGLKTLLAPLFHWRVPVRWYIFALGLMLAAKLAVALAYRLIAGQWPQHQAQSIPVFIAAAVFTTLVGGQLGEELGWRGYALPRLRSRMGMALASLLLGVIWAIWHLPLFYSAGTPYSGQSLTVYTLQVTALSVAIAFLYAHTDGSLFLAMLMHAAINNTAVVLPYEAVTPGNPLSLNASLTSWLTVVVLWCVAACLLFRMPEQGNESTS